MTNFTESTGATIYSKRRRDRRTRPWTWAQAHKGRCALLVAIGLLGGYGVTYGVVASASSVTDEQLVLDDDRMIGISRWGPTAPRVRIVLVHGAPADASCWENIRDLAASLPEAEWIAVDRLGYGNSSSACETSLAAHARSIEPFLKDAPDGGVIVVGHSFGGPVALRAAVEYSDQLTGIVLVAGACDAYMNDAQWFRKGVKAVGRAVPASWANANRELLALTEENRAMEPLLERVTCPVTLIHGTWDPVCPYDGTVGYLESRLTNAEWVKVVKLERAGHNLHLSRAGVIVGEVGEMVRSGAVAPD